MSINRTKRNLSVANNIIQVLPDRLSSSVPFVYNPPDADAKFTLQAGHGWGATNNAGGDLNYTGDFYQGSQCIKLTTVGNGVATYCTSPRLTNIDLRAKMVRLWLKIDAASENYISMIQVYIGGGAAAFTWFASTMIIRPASDGNTGTVRASDGWYGFTFNIGCFPTITGTPDWSVAQDFRVRVVDDNTAHPATLLVGGMEFIANHASYPHGAVSICFDDGYDTCYTDAMVKLDTYSYKATAFIIQDLLGIGTGLTLTHLAALRANGWDICPHAYYADNHNNSGGFATLSDNTITDDLSRINLWLKGGGYAPRQIWAYPQGLFTQALINLIKPRWYSSARTTNSRTIETLPVGNPFRLRSLAASNTTAVTPNSTPETLEWYVDQTYANGGLFIVTFHKLVAAPAVSTEFGIANFGTFVDYCNTKGIPVIKLSTALYG